MASRWEQSDGPPPHLPASLPPGKICFAEKSGCRFTSDCKGGRWGVVRRRLGWEVGGGETGAAGAENKQDAAPGGSAGVRTWQGGKDCVARPRHRINPGGGRSASGRRHPSPTRGAHRSPQLPVGKSLNWAPRQPDEKALVPPAGRRGRGRGAPLGRLAWCAHRHTQPPPPRHGLTGLPPLCPRTQLGPREAATGRRC